MASLIYEDLMEYYSNDDKNNVNWYDKYLLKLCNNFADGMDDNIIEEVVNEYYETAVTYIYDKYELCPQCVTYRDLYTALLERWVIDIIESS